MSNCLKSSSHSVPSDGIPDSFRHNKTETSRFVFGMTRSRVDDAVCTAHAASCSNNASKIFTSGDAMSPCWHDPRRSETYAVSFARPLPRRAETIARPARVRMRARKPCTFARRRLFGWKVRLLMRNSVMCVLEGTEKSTVNIRMECGCPHKRYSLRDNHLPRQSDLAKHVIITPHMFHHAH